MWSYHRLLQIGVLGLAVLASGCDRAVKLEPLPKQDAKWAEYINMHSPARISKTDKIRVMFVNDIITDEKLGKEASNAIEITPAISGQWTFVTKREIELVPKDKLPSGQHYRVRVYGDRLKDIASELKYYEFDVEVIKQEFEVKLEGLNTISATDPNLTLRGTLLSADQEEPAQIEKVLAVEYNNKTLAIQWQHAPNNKEHGFSIVGIERGNEAKQLRLSWNGKQIGVDSQGKHAVDIPALNEFKLVEVRVVQDARSHIDIQFSDQLDRKQNLRGLIQVSQDSANLNIENNTVKVFPKTGFAGEVTVSIEASVRNAKGIELGQKVTRTVNFASEKPQVRFTGNGVILPENQLLSIPFEAVNVNEVQVTAFLIYDNNIGHFLQYNKLDGNNGLQQVGRYLWRKSIKLDNAKPNLWNRYAIDATELLQKQSGALYQLTLSIHRGNSIYSCSAEDQALPVKKEQPIKNYEDTNLREASSWDYAEEYYNPDYQRRYADRKNPCKDAYYQHEAGAKQSRNFMASNIGLIGKYGEDDRLHVATTNLRTAQTLSAVDITVMNFQNQPIAKLKTDANGLASVAMNSRPFYLIANKDKQVGYLKLSTGSALAVSQFDVGGEKVTHGVKGFIYGERGVWRPGDDIYLTFVLEDKNNVIPDKHPVTLELRNPKGQLIQSVTNSKPVGNFYTFHLKTMEDAPTGNWQAKALLGGSVFTKNLKIETVMPNRLKIDLDFGKEELYQSEMPIKATLSSQWLHGATAAKLKTDVAVKLETTKTKFTRNADFIFDDPTRKFRGERQVLFEGNLNDKGVVQFEPQIQLGTEAPGNLLANFTARVFEDGGAFSTNNKSVPFFPYEDYVGIRLPKGDQAREMLLTDKKHTVEIASLSANGEPVSLPQVDVNLYKLEWKWWWDQSGDAQAQYENASLSTSIQHAVIATNNGLGKWEFEIKYPEWGRFLIRACDLQGQHCTGQIFYIDWPAWAGKAREQSGVGASMLSFSSDKPRYQVGDKAKIRLPEASQGRALVSVENGVRVLSTRWVELDKNNTSFDVKITQEMTPNVYVNVTLVQPHENKSNDRPIRLYGVIPLLVDDPATRITPKLNVAEEWRPETEVTVAVSEEKGRAMTYTLAVVDEGLLGLTNHKTPNLHDHFYKKEALGVMTWDLFDEVTGAYGGELERLLSLGGGDEADDAKKGREKKRFPPVVKFLGVFELGKGEHKKHKLTLPQYVGAVRVMAVAGAHGAYGSADKSVPVRQPLSMLATLPRVIGPEEEMLVPVSLFAMDKDIKEATVTIETSEQFEIVGDKSAKVQFKAQEEQMAFLKLKVKDVLGKGQVRLTAKSGEHSTKSETYIEVRTANPPSSRFISKVIAPGEKWSSEVVPFGLAGTNRVMLEVSVVPPINLDSRLQYLITYPHGCVEQITSSIFPQIYLPKLVKLDDKQKADIQTNVQIAVQRLRQYQHSNGGFVYWPGYAEFNHWATNYAGHFIIEAQRLGYYVPPEMISQWLNHQRNVAQNWVIGSGQSELDQSYRLYTLALAGKAEMGAMNRLRESKSLSSTTRWQLASAYMLAGLPDAAKSLVKDDKFKIDDYASEGMTFGSALRDEAIILNSLALLGNWEEAKRFADNVAKELSADKWHSTQAVAFGLMAMASFVGKENVTTDMVFEQQLGKGAMVKRSSNTPIDLQTLADFPLQGQQIVINNPGKRNLYVTISSSGVAKSGNEQESAKGLAMEVKYTDSKGNALDISKVAQGTDVIARIRVRNHSQRKLDNLALAQVIPSGWQIHNERVAQQEAAAPVTTPAVKELDYQDIRDDRIYTYFGLKSGEEKEIKVLLNASYLGRYYLPSISVEAMYDAKIHARSKGQWVDVVKQAKP